MDTIIQEVNQATSNWKTIAKELGISRGEIELMTKAFNSQVIVIIKDKGEILSPNKPNNNYYR